YNAYWFYGDTAIIGEHYASMEKYMDFQIGKSAATGYFYPEDSWRDANPAGGFGDWLSLTDRHLAHDILASLYFAHSLGIMAEMSAAIGREARAAYYRDIREKSMAAFIDHYVDEEGRFVIDETAYGDGQGYFEGERGFTGHTQSGYATALYFDLLPDSLAQLAGGHLVDLVVAADTLPTSGILGIRQLLPALSKIGRSDLAYAMLLSRRYPGWGFQIANGATTIWERWNSYTQEAGFNGEMNAKMNSFNHYAFGAVGQWLFQQGLGIDAEGPGFEQIVIRPAPDPRVGSMSGEYQSVAGTIVSGWEYLDEELKLTVTIPEGGNARIVLPPGTGDRVRVHGQRVRTERARGERSIPLREGRHVILLDLTKD
ncbi:MAG: alpha-L-rhamnosidase C-terminal domain-containing protein, partial [Lewinella sp.]